MVISSLYMVISLHPLKSTLFLQNKKVNKRPAVKKQALSPVDNSELVLNCFSGKCNCHGLFGTKYSAKSSGGATNRGPDSGSYRQFSSVKKVHLRS